MIEISRWLEERQMIANVIRQVTKRRLSHAIAFLLYYVFFAGCGLAEIQILQDSQALPSTVSLKKFLQTLDDNKETRYVAAFKDLNGDGTPEAIVYMAGPNGVVAAAATHSYFANRLGPGRP